MQPAFPQDPDDPPGTVVDEAVLAQRRERRAEDQQPLIDRAAAAERAVAGLESRAQELRAELDRATTDRNDAVRRLGLSESALRAARQAGFAEEQQRIAAEADLAGARREADALRGNLDAARARVAELEREVRATRGRLEAELAALQELADGLTERLEAEGQAREAAVAGAQAEAVASASDADFSELAARVAAAQRRADAAASALGAARTRNTRDAEQLATARRTVAALQDSAAALREEGDALRVGAAQELASVTQERDGLVAQVSIIETKLEQLGSRFEEARAAMQQRVDEEQAARVAAEAALEQERSRLASEIAGERDALRARVSLMLRELEAGLARVRAEPPAVVAAPTPTTSPVAPPAAAQAATVVEPQASPPPITLPADLRAELERLNAALGAAQPAPGADDVIAGLARAAQRLRTQVTEAATASAPPVTQASPPARAEPGPASGRRTWLASVIGQLELRDPRAAADLLIALLPVQGGLGAGPACYDLTVDGVEPIRVTVVGGGAEVRPAPAGDAAGADFTVAGSPTALAPLVAGGIRWPVRIPSSMQVTGRRRRLRRVLRAMRHPVVVADLRTLVTPVDPGLVLGALSAVVSPEWTRGYRFVIVFELTDGRGWRVEVADEKLTLSEGPPDGAPAEQPTATVRTSASGLLALIDGVPSGSAPTAEIEGSRHAVEFLLGWWDRVQGLPDRTA